ncbi:flavin reductase family protein [Nocardioides sp. Kera G14]|uniref:flavin reductase family protein n=1 Tax=Nocardioides sp. Kera G14 TaxID=2884264 RepID=UPI001D128D79|nr:flavin reductase family protein [Nocardioides sp. Kera G14]UDY24582.1 flavin reductase family protein [Nocardioides sp. Kera G14]
MSSPFTSAEFRETLGHYPTGVAVVTGIASDGTPAGMVVGSFTSVSLDPPLVAFLPTKDSGSWARLSTAERFCVNVLAADQEDLCRRFASRIPDKFDGVAWTPAPGGSPVFEESVAWIECSHHDVVDGGDHWIVLGRVTDLKVSRPALPLLFFQGGYGRFSPPSLVAPTSPEIITAVRLAELARDRIETLALTHGADCSVLTKSGNEVCFVLTANHSPVTSGISVGHRMPLVAPLGAVYLTDSDGPEAEAWLASASGQDEETLALLRRNLETVVERGYSLSLTSPESTERMSVIREYSSGGGLPQHARTLKSLIADTTRLYEPEITDGERYSLHSIVVRVPQPAGAPPIALRMGELPADADASVVRQWVADVQEVATYAGELAASTSCVEAAPAL